MKTIFTLLLLTVLSPTSFSQNRPAKELDDNLNYAFITVQGKSFSKKLDVKVDFGDSEAQIKAGEEYSTALNNKKSYAAVLNHMSERQFELIETRDVSYSFQGTGSNNGIIYIMRRALKAN